MLGSLPEADDAVQDTWLRVIRAGVADVENLGGWLTTIVARICLNVLRSRAVRREESLEARVPDPLITREGTPPPEEGALLADAVGLALQVVLDSLNPAERLAFVLHDMFDLPFDEIAPMVDRSPGGGPAAGQPSRRRVRGAAQPAPDITRQRAVVDAFFAAARGGNFNESSRSCTPTSSCGRISARVVPPTPGSSRAQPPWRSKRVSGPTPRRGCTRC